MSKINAAGTVKLGHRHVKRLGYGAMQLAGPGVFGPPKDRDGALAVLREAVAAGVDHIDTSDFYGPHVTNQLIREALAPYPDEAPRRSLTCARTSPPPGWSCRTRRWRPWTAWERARTRPEARRRLRMQKAAVLLREGAPLAKVSRSERGGMSFASEVGSTSHPLFDSDLTEIKMLTEYVQGVYS
ncbi:aldo/keto reductase [Sorangium sp. So ce307]